MLTSPPWMLAPGMLVCALSALASMGAAQSNQNPNLDTRLSNLGGFEVFGRVGAFPIGTNGVAFGTTVCNDGSEEVPWFQPMNAHHPTIGFLIARVTDGRIEQISDRSFVKHGFFAANTTGCGRPCQQPGVGSIGEHLGIGCSDTYASANNGDNFYLGPPDEIDPWLGTWTGLCSHFDRGEPPVAAPNDCNGLRSFTHSMGTALGPVAHRIHLDDADLLAPGTFYYQGQYVIEGEPEAARDDNLGSRQFVPTFNGNRWELQQTGTLLHGSVLQRWSGAQLASAKNGGDDGRVFVALKVSGPVDGFWHYEYALHNRDNRRGLGALRIPLCADARVRATGFRDADDDPADDWTATRAGGELVFGTLTSPLRWNTLYNVWFDSDAAPAAGALGLDEFEPGAGLSSLALALDAPLVLSSVYLGAGCSAATPPTLFASGTPAAATLGNASFALVSAGNEPGQANLLRFALGSGSAVVQGCTLWIGGAGSSLASSVISDGAGRATHAAPIPPDPALEGVSVRTQVFGRVSGTGALFGHFDASDGLLVRVGSVLPGCP